MPVVFNGDSGLSFPNDTDFQYNAPKNFVNGRNLIRNGAMRVSQVATSFVISSQSSNFVNDGYFIDNQTIPQISVAQVEGDAPPGFNHSLRIANQTTDSTIGVDEFLHIRQAVEGVECQEMDFGTVNAKTISVQFWFKTSKSGTYYASIRNSAKNRGYIFPVSVNGSEINTWKKFTKVIPGDVSGTWDKTTGVGFLFTIVFVAGSNSQIPIGSTDTWSNISAGPPGGQSSTDQVNFLAETNTAFLTGVQIEVSDYPTKFDYVDIASEMIRLQRYRELGSGKMFQSAVASTSIAINYRVVKRNTPTVSFQNLTNRTQPPTSIEWNDFRSFGVNRNTNEVSFGYLAVSDLS